MTAVSVHVKLGWLFSVYDGVDLHQNFGSLFRETIRERKRQLKMKRQ